MKSIAVVYCGSKTPYTDQALDILRTQYGEVRVLPKEDANLADLILLTGGAERSTRGQLISGLVANGAVRNRIVPEMAICVYGFTMDKYIRLLESNPTIFSNNCAAGMIYHLFGIPFLSPTINMFMENDSFLKFARMPGAYLSHKLELHSMVHGENGEYPVFKLGVDVFIHMNHYHNPESAKAQWYKRLKRINPDNLIFMMYTDSAEELAEFHMLPYEKKICFVPFPCKLDTAYPIPPDIDCGAKFWQLVLAVADGSLQIYDLWEMLLFGRKKQIIEF